ncbi:MAG: hypothetical protein M1814_001058 [Vezdaea aestivalis]|nr:MAG: hypothetical protein M1814_001058 [Vezdaea aestivalis]
MTQPWNYRGPSQSYYGGLGDPRGRQPNVSGTQSRYQDDYSDEEEYDDTNEESGPPRRGPFPPQRPRRDRGTFASGQGRQPQSPASPSAGDFTVRSSTAYGPGRDGRETRPTSRPTQRTASPGSMASNPFTVMGGGQPETLRGTRFAPRPRQETQGPESMASNPFTAMGGAEAQPPRGNRLAPRSGHEGSGRAARTAQPRTGRQGNVYSPNGTPDSNFSSTQRGPRAGETTSSGATRAPASTSTRYNPRGTTDEPATTASYTQTFHKPGRPTIRPGSSRPPTARLSRDEQIALRIHHEQELENFHAMVNAGRGQVRFKEDAHPDVPIAGRADFDVLYAKMLEALEFADPKTGEFQMPPSTEKECTVCMDDKPWSEFPSDTITKDCKHGTGMCLDCVQESITAQQQSKMWSQITCPEDECNEKLTYHDMKLWATPESFEQYDKLVLLGVIEKEKNFIWCTNCSAGQIHSGGKSMPLLECATCGLRTCLKHKSKWHEDMNCDEFDEEQRQAAERERQALERDAAAKKRAEKKKREEAEAKKARAKENEESERIINKYAKKCPNPRGCGARLYRGDGCQHMTCQLCGWEYCDLCLATWSTSHFCAATAEEYRQRFGGFPGEGGRW